MMATIPMKYQKKWARFWMRHADLSRSGRIASYMATWFAPPYKARTYLARLTDKGFVSPNAAIHHKNLEISQNVYIGDRVIIYQADKGGFVKIGERTHLHQETIIETGAGGGIRIGSDTHIQPRCQFSAYKGNIEIGSDVQIAPFCAFYPYNHEFLSDKPIRQQTLTTKGGIVIEDDAWLGVRTIVLDGVRIGKGTVIAAGSVVSHDIPDHSIAVGTPARVIKTRKDMSA